jgi:hypothetical protein
MGIGGAFGAAMADGRIGMVECLNQRFGHSHLPSSILNSDPVYLRVAPA